MNAIAATEIRGRIQRTRRQGRETVTKTLQGLLKDVRDIKATCVWVQGTIFDPIRQRFVQRLSFESVGNWLFAFVMVNKVLQENLKAKRCLGNVG